MIEDKEEILAQLKLLAEQNKALSAKVEEFAEGDDLEIKFDREEPTKKYSQMLEINPEMIDSFGDSIELVTKSRLGKYDEAYKVALGFVGREYHNMVGNRYGRHSKLIPVYDNNGKLNKIDMVWFSGNDVKIVKIKEWNGKEREYYKIRLLVSDILTKKMLLARIPTSDGKARDEEIKHMGAGRLSEQGIQDMLNISPMKPIRYSGQSGQRRMTTKNVGEMVFE